MRPIAIVGPTGTGKSALALAVAERVGGEIVNADAMQLYRGMDIGTAKLPVAERRGVPHHQLDVLDVTQTASVARYQQAAAADVEAIAARGAVPIVVGGSMMYIQSLARRMDLSGDRPGGAGEMGAASRRGGRGRVASGAGRGRRRCRGIDPAHRRAPHRAGVGGGRTDRPAFRGVVPGDRRTPVGHCDPRVGLGDKRSR